MSCTFVGDRAHRSAHGAGPQSVWLVCLSISASSLLSLPGLAQDLGHQLVPLIEAHAGQVAVAVKHLDTGRSFFYQADRIMPTASLIKVAVMLEVYQQVEEGRISLSEPVTLRQEDKVPGSGILTEHFSVGARFPLRDAVRLMIAFSDNTATNMVLDRVGLAAVNKRMEAWGFAETKIHSKVFRRDTSLYPERSRRYGLGSTTAREMLALLEKLHHRQLVSAAASAEMLEHLKKCTDRDKFPRLLPAGTTVAHKTGSVSDARNDAGILYTPGGPIALCVLTAGNRDTSWTQDNAGDVLCARIARVVYDVFNPGKASPPGTIEGRPAGGVVPSAK